uniref:Uncharacterized protein n=1 Tax=Globisporangium ultimum (strain ATCC 200006 / CBS 805.95 / DAOM BR144) TaxID=431595 RepID=K3X004_GLOUD
MEGGLLGPGFGVGLNAFVYGLVGLHVLVLGYWVMKFLQDTTNSSKRSIKKRQ